MTNVLGKRHLEEEEVEEYRHRLKAPCSHPRPVPSAGKAPARMVFTCPKTPRCVDVRTHINTRLNSVLPVA